MEEADAMDREVIIERADSVRLWLLGLGLAMRATKAIERELSAIIADDPGSYIDGQRPLAGLTVDAFIAELHRPGGGAVGRVKSVGDAVLNELRTAIAAQEPPPAPAPDVAPEPPAPSLEEALEPPPAPDEFLEPPPAPDEAPAPPARRGPGRPKGSTKAKAEAQPQAAPAAAEDAVAKPRRGRPRREAAASTLALPAAAAPPAAPAPPAPIVPDEAAPALGNHDDPMLGQIIRLWPSLHPHARRAVVIYVSALWAEATHEG